MVETNIRIVGYGERLHLDVRSVHVRTSDATPDLPEKACRLLRLNHGLAAVPHLSDSALELFVIGADPVSLPFLEGDNWRVEMRGVGQRRLYVNEPRDVLSVAKLFERYLQIQLRRHTSLWTLDSPRIWYEVEPFRIEHGIAAYRRFHASVVPVEGEGIGIVVHGSTAFFTVDTVAAFFDESLPTDERERRQHRFEELSLRQRGQKGTLLYDLGRSHHKCYFVEFLVGVTCATTGPIPVNGTTYLSLEDYYRRERSYSGVAANDPVARVSFRGLDRPCLVAANRLRLRVMNTDLPKALKQVDKIPPGERARLVDRFWDTVGEDLLGKGLKSGLWQPSAARVVHVQLPTLRFGQDKELPPPARDTADAYKAHFGGRLRTLNLAGCNHVPPTIQRQITVAHPSHLSSATIGRFSDEVVKRLNQWTRRNLNYEMVPYSAIPEAIAELNSREPGIAVFVFESIQPETYYLLSAELRDWRIKRLTLAQLLSRHRQPSFIDMNALDILEKLGCVPWALAASLNYQAQLAIDVGVDRRYFALSLLVCQAQSYETQFRLDGLVCPKPDYRRETIEHDMLRDQIVKLCGRLLVPPVDPIESLLVLRDGREGGEESEAIREAQAELRRLRVLSSDARLDIVDFAKRSLKDIRLWSHSGSGVTNVLEGTALILDGRTVVLTSTGAATLHLGTADPLVLTATHDGVDMLAVTSDVFATAQLNWSSPGVAQRLPVSIRRTDQELETRRAQEIRGLR